MKGEKAMLYQAIEDCDVIGNKHDIFMRLLRQVCPRWSKPRRNSRQRWRCRALDKWR